MLGLLSRTNLTPKIIYPYLGDYLYAILYFLILGFLFNAQKTIQVTLTSIFLCFFIETSQLCQQDWINNIRSYKIGGLILGHGFLWTDIISYSLGGITGYFVESIFFKNMLFRKSY